MALSAQTPTDCPATLKDFLAIPPSKRFHEILDGELVQKTTPSYDHGRVQARLVMSLSPYDDDDLQRGPGGWLIATEVEILLGDTPYRPDVVGWRSERMAELPAQFPVPVRPDWVCEVVSPSDEARDTVIKYRDYARAGIPYYWMFDLRGKRLTALRLSGEHYMLQAEGKIGESVRAEPFELVEVVVARLLGSSRSRPTADH